MEWPTGHQAIEARDGAQRIAISVDNDVKGGTPSNYPVHPNAKAVVEAVLAEMWSQNTTPPITSININSTVRAKTGKRSAHPDGRSVDINEINGKHVRCAHPDFAAHKHCKPLSSDDIENLKTQIRALQDAFWADCRVNQILGPVINQNKWEDQPSEDLKKRHRDHIHVNVFS